MPWPSQAWKRPENSREAQFAAGRSYLRANLQATGLDLGMQPWSQCLQEYPSMATTLARVRDMQAPGGGRVQMLARFGYAEPVPPSPRRGLAAQILRT